LFKQAGDCLQTQKQRKAVRVLLPLVQIEYAQLHAAAWIRQKKAQHLSPKPKADHTGGRGKAEALRRRTSRFPSPTAR
jgi:hypothetical protein